MKKASLVTKCFSSAPKRRVFAPLVRIGIFPLVHCSISTRGLTADASKQGDQTCVERSLDVAILGAPNAGKSTLLNLLVGGKVSAVSPKRNTTRESVVGILSDTKEKVQIVFHDTPGYVDYRAAGRFVRELHVGAREAVGAVDRCLVLVDAARRFDAGARRDFEALIDNCIVAERPVAVVLNKADLVHPKPRLLLTADALWRALEGCQERRAGAVVRGEDPGEGAGRGLKECNSADKGSRFDLTEEAEFFMISAGKNDGVDDVKSYLFSHAYEREWEYEEDVITEFDEEELVSEIIREQLYRRFHKEVPYRVEQFTRDLKVSEDHSFIRINQELIVPNDSQRKIIIGNNGNSLKAVMAAARDEIKRALGCGEVIINISVKATKKK